VSTESWTQLSAAGGIARWTIAIPNHPGLVGSSFFVLARRLRGHELPRLVSEASGAPARPDDFASVAAARRATDAKSTGRAGAARALYSCAASRTHSVVVAPDPDARDAVPPEPRRDHREARRRTRAIREPRIHRMTSRARRRRNAPLDPGRSRISTSRRSRDAAPATRRGAVRHWVVVRTPDPDARKPGPA
jgi:hypothetical protein